MRTTTGTTAANETPDSTTGRLSWPPLIALSLGYFLVMLDVTVVTVAVPVIRDAVGAGASATAWIVDGYSAVFGGLLLLGGGFGDRLGHRKVFLTGLGVFTLASAACALATTPAALIAGRLAQGAGAALLVPTSLALLTAAHPTAAVRAKALGVWAGVSGVAFAAGPLVGGLLVAGLSWRAAFWINVPVALLAVRLTRAHVPSPAGRAGARGLDPLGQALGIVGVLAPAAVLNEAGAQGWTSPVVLGTSALGAAALVLFVLVERRTEARGLAEKPPLLPLSLFRSPGFSPTIAVGVLLNLGYYGMLYLSTLYLQNERGYGAPATGLALLPTVCMALVAAPLSGRLTARHGPYAPMTGALLLGAAGFTGWLLAGPDTPYWVLLPALVATGLATPSTVLAATAAVAEAAPAENAGVASAVFNVARQIGNSLGVALFASLVAGRDLVSGLHISALVASAAFFTAALLALSCRRRAKARTAS
ncbi:DHA2 family methylenomycin A resistance protein-like MFS transporter [Streptomyces sp. PanSC19]|uniref:MFS transporter n=1 Tax=Streptomyces sp. PanSC19 TaxID=1520455 RepID=UPI000F4A090B|nr:MFS transporter [Streptomyces sp. PanSC19]ROQ36488.1 DHA2 family methylenomycin A resistance protein-like MFS transporter [Streptomyces sp. PanSC19]